jgi:hypothetical protein
MERDYLIYHNLDAVYYRCLVECAAAAFVNKAENEHLGVLIGMLSERTIDDYRQAVARHGGNAEAAVSQLFVAHLTAQRAKISHDEGAALMARLASAPPEEIIPEKKTFQMA